MREIGNPLEVIDSQPVVLPAPLRKETETPVGQPMTVKVPVPETTVEPATVIVERS